MIVVAIAEPYNAANDDDSVDEELRCIWAGFLVDRLVTPLSSLVEVSNGPCEGWSENVGGNLFEMVDAIWGMNEGDTVGVIVGSFVGIEDGFTVGNVVGDDGNEVGVDEGIKGDIVGFNVGDRDKIGQ